MTLREFAMDRHAALEAPVMRPVAFRAFKEEIASFVVRDLDAERRFAVLAIVPITVPSGD